MNKPLIEIKNLTKHFSRGGTPLRAVENFNLDIYPGETVGLVGESGCGKSTVGRLLLRLHEPTAGKVLFHGENIFDFKRKALFDFRRKAQIVFQDPFASLNPRMTVANIIGEALDIHQLVSKEERRARIEELLHLVGLKSQHLNRFPHEFSGGQRQRVGIARAIAVEPQFIVCDEPISSLDVSIQAQVINLLKDLQEKMGLTFLFIAHDLAMVEYLADRVAVMYLGHLVEVASSAELYQRPLHPYTEALFSAIPTPDPQLEKKRSRIVLQGEQPSPLQVPKGCVFCSRCPKVMDVCRNTPPPLQEVEKGHWAACHLNTSSS